MTGDVKDSKRQDERSGFQENKRLDKQFDFLREIDKEKEIVRRTYLTDGTRCEDDAEHAWHLAMMVMMLSEYANEKIDRYHTMSMVLIHDLIEIYAGDTYAYDIEGNKTKRERELKAADRLFTILPEDQANEMRLLWDEFESDETAEAHFANMCDKVQPVMLTDANGGKSWKGNGVFADWLYKRNERSHEGSEKIWEYIDDNMIKPAIDKGWLKKDDEK